MPGRLVHTVCLVVSLALAAATLVAPPRPWLLARAEADVSVRARPLPPALVVPATRGVPLDRGTLVGPVLLPRTFAAAPPPAIVHLAPAPTPRPPRLVALDLGTSAARAPPAA